MRTSSPVTRPSGAPSRAAKASGSSVRAFTRPSAARMREANTASTPAPRASGDAATTIASRRFPGPSPAGSSAERWAPVSTTGRGSSVTRSSRNAVSSRVSVPCVTTTPSTSSRASASATASWIVRRSACVSANELTRRTSCVSTVTPAGRAGTDPSRRSAGSAATAAPSGRVREEMVPPVASTRTWGMRSILGRTNDCVNGLRRTITLPSCCGDVSPSEACRLHRGPPAAGPRRCAMLDRVRRPE